MVSKLDSQSKGCGFESHPILDGNGFMAMCPILVKISNEKKEIKGSEIRHTKFIFRLNVYSKKVVNTVCAKDLGKLGLISISSEISLLSQQLQVILLLQKVIKSDPKSIVLICLQS